ncbi:protein of unknown function [Nitrospira japonica]|uniref:Uncharacterized protein n=1 Tax=Nitrospira japonica TaxID=1325564 RepID=A0A1W1I0E6_9BACT|nr:hypothetical protein [Nitrospira japonica]SLM46480.1 protein of unknown function [Nitrospira japonica]
MSDPISLSKARQSASPETWLGAETHVPNLSRELRRRERFSWQLATPVIALALLVSGALIGSAATWLIFRARRPR